MSAALTGIIVAVVAGVFGLGGAALGAHRDHERWLRQARLDAYAALVTAVTALTVSHVLRLRVRRATTHVPEDVAGKDSLERLQAFSDLTRAEAVVHLLGPDAIDQLATDFVRCAQRVAMDDSNSGEARSNLDRLQAEFVHTARSHLTVRRARGPVFGTNRYSDHPDGCVDL